MKKIFLFIISIITFMSAAPATQILQNTENNRTAPHISDDGKAVYEYVKKDNNTTQITPTEDYSEMDKTQICKPNEDCNISKNK